MLDRLKVNGRLTLMWSEALRALLCMLPMFVFSAQGDTRFLVALGQGGCYFSSMFLPATRRRTTVTR
jgi:hypothetical protein